MVFQKPALPHPLRLATRQSQLALAQANMAASALSAQGYDCTLLPLSTSGDQILDKPLYDIGGKGLFVKELEAALLAGDADIAVHSCKDIPGLIPKTLPIIGCLVREDPADIMISHRYANLDTLPKSAIIGTSSPRRAAQLRHFRQDLQIIPLRGNIATRISKLSTEGLDAIILAKAGLERLGQTDKITAIIPTNIMLPAVGQGIIALQANHHANTLRTIANNITHPATWLAMLAERSFLRHMEGNCTSPIAALAQIDNDTQSIELTALFAAMDGSWLIKRSDTAPLTEAEHLGKALADAILHDAQKVGA